MGSLSEPQPIVTGLLLVSKPKIEAVDHVELLVPPCFEEPLRWFYGDCAGLSETKLLTGHRGLTFHSEKLTLRLVEQPGFIVDSVAVRMTVRVADLNLVVEKLTSRGYTIEEQRGMTYTDRSIFVLDPVGYRVEFRRFWPVGPF